jgi:uncharacterized protein YggE
MFLRFKYIQPTLTEVPMKLSLFVLPALLLVSLAVAQPPAPEPRVTAQGTGDILVAPDMAKFSVESVNNDDSPIDAAKDTRKDMAAILAAARRLVRNPADLRTTRVSINPEYEWVEGKRKFRGYAASQTLEITVRDLSKLDSLMEDLTRAKITTLGSLEFQHSKADSLRREALAYATQNARLNAAKICEPLGVACNEILGIRMAGTAGPGPMPMFAERMIKSDAASNAPLQAGVLTFSASVEADFKLK